MATNPRFQVRETEEGLRALDNAIKALGYADRAHWYKEMKRITIKKYKEEMTMYEKYCEWRKVSEEMLDDGFIGSLDCGEQRVREDFSNFAELDEEISFKEMLKLEKRYEGSN